MAALVRAIRRAGGAVSSSADAVTRIANIRAVRTGLSTVDNLMDAIPFQHINGRIRAGANMTIGAVEELIRRGDLATLARQLNLNSNITSNVENQFRRLIRNTTPDVRISELDTNITRAVRSSPDLNLNQITETAMTTTTRRKVNNIWRTFKRGAAGTLILTGTFTAIYIGVDAIVGLNRATAERNGCFMSRMINNEMITCKINARSCRNPDSEMQCSAVTGIPLNTTTYLFYLASQQTFIDTDLLEQLQEINSSITSINDETVKMILESVPLFEVAEKHYQELGSTSYDACITPPSTIENGLVPECRCCIGSASEISSQFLDTVDIAENITFSCVTNSTIIETIVDVALEAGGSIWDSISGYLGLQSVLRIFIIGLAVILFIAIAISIFSRMPKKKPTITT